MKIISVADDDETSSLIRVPWSSWMVIKDHHDHHHNLRWWSEPQSTLPAVLRSPSRSIRSGAPTPRSTLHGDRRSPSTSPRCGAPARSFRQRFNFFLRKASPLAAWWTCFWTSFGKLHLWRLDELVSERSLTYGGFLRKALPLAGWRLSERSFTSGASFGKLHLWRGGGFLKEAREDGLLSSSTQRIPENTRSTPHGDRRSPSRRIRCVAPARGLT